MKIFGNDTLKRFFLTILRMLVGWHFLYEGFDKLVQEKWSAGPYLMNATGFLADFYKNLASDPEILPVVDLLNMYGLVAIGLGLFLGVMIRCAAFSGALLLTLYYLAYPPFGVSLALHPEPGIFIVNSQFIEAAALLVFVFIPDTGYGLDVLFYRFFRWIFPKKQQVNAPAEQPPVRSRRDLIGAVLKNLATFPMLGLFGWGAADYRKRYADVVTGATVKIGAVDISQLKGELPRGKIKDHEISRLVLGGNLIGGWAHSRDLIYVGSLFKAYNTEKKIFDTLMLAERAGINTINIGFPSNALLQKYKRLTGSKIKVISQVAPGDSTNLFADIDKAIDYGADIIQIQGNQGDWLVRDSKIEIIARMLERIRSQDKTAGLGAHSVETLIRTQEQGIIPDYYMKTMHHDGYWSAHPRANRVPFEVDGKRNREHDKFHDNMWCLFPERSVEFVNQTQVPVMGFKVLAAGAIQPKEGFRWAFQNGADFICVGMFDFQVVADVNITIDTLKEEGVKNRRRSWCG